MNEKAKTIAKYALTALGGAILGVALLGGVSYCATSSAREKAETNTIYEGAKTRKNAQIETENGGYDGYAFSVRSFGSDIPTGYYRTFRGEIDTSTYTLQETYQYPLEQVEDGYSNIQTAINAKISAITPTDNGAMRFLMMEGVSHISVASNTIYWRYFTFLTSDQYSTTNELIAFVLTNEYYGYGVKLDGYDFAFRGSSFPIILTAERTNYFVYSFSQQTDMSTYNFQDVESYYQERGYTTGYARGWQNGWNNSPGGVSTTNVFSLFTRAFDAVGGFFNLEIFGFLPLYWFFLAPLFITLITLLLRMVKH